jgi:uncharacterized membrane protein YsdA (DUF1294 family)/cold shock CspA family protein
LTPHEIVNVFLVKHRIAMRLRGKLTKWKDDRGFGFITPIRGGDQVFVHIKAFTNQHRRPIRSEFVTYETVCDDTGRLRAEHVEFMGEDSINAAEGWMIALTIALLFLMFLGVTVLIGQLPFVVLPFYVGVSVISFLVYRRDKSAAHQNQWRTGEGTLILLGVLGGWPGAFVAQQFFHHKTKKRSFQIAFWVTVVVNCVGLVLLLSL